MDEPRARRFLLPRSRRLTTDVLHYHRKIPLCPHDRVIDLSAVRELRSQLPERVSWSLLFIKAYALVARDIPQLRQLYYRWPVAHVYEHPETVFMMALQREYRGEPWLFWARFEAPEKQPLVQLQQRLTQLQTSKVRRAFKAQVQLSGLPTPLRRMIWAWNLNVATEQRARRTGTAFLSTLSARGAEIQNPPAFLTGNLTYGPMDASGRSRVTLSYDHRLMDGALVADALARIEDTLNNPIATELRDLIATASSHAA